MPAHRDAGTATVASAVGAGTAALLLITLFVGAGAGLFVGNAAACRRQADTTRTAQTSIPADYLTLYRAAGRQSGLPWNLLAAIGKIETNHGRLDAPGVTTGTNAAGAAGPMQFLLSTWEAYGVDGNGDGRKDVYNPADAIPAAANYLKAHGAPADIRGALYAYNHSAAYVDSVLGWAGRYADGGVQAVAAMQNAACQRDALGPLPAGVAGKVIEFARAQLGEPYVWGAEGPDAWDCSGLTMMAYRAAGISIPRVTHQQVAFGAKVPRGQERPGDLVFFRYDNGYVGHVGIVIGDGKMIEAQQTGVPVKVSPYEGRHDIAGFTRPAARATSSWSLLVRCL